MSSTGATTPRQTSLFVDLDVWEQVHAQVQKTDKRIELAGVLAEKDPVMVLELLRGANLMAINEGKAPLMTSKTALVRLGLEGTNELLASIKTNPRLTNESLLKHFEDVRHDCTHIGGLSGEIATVLARNLKDDAVTVGLFVNLGELIAIPFLGEKYLAAADGNSRAKILYRLEKDHSFNTEQIGLDYLKHVGMPEPIVSVIDREAKPRITARQILKAVTQVARELYFAAREDKLEKFKPGETLPLKSTLRLMQLKDIEHKNIFERVCDYVLREKVMR